MHLKTAIHHSVLCDMYLQYFLNKVLESFYMQCSPSTEKWWVCNVLLFYNLQPCYVGLTHKIPPQRYTNVCSCKITKCQTNWRSVDTFARNLKWSDKLRNDKVEEKPKKNYTIVCVVSTEEAEWINSVSSH